MTRPLWQAGVGASNPAGPLAQTAGPRHAQIRRFRGGIPLRRIRRHSPARRLPIPAWAGNEGGENSGQNRPQNSPINAHAQGAVGGAKLEALRPPYPRPAGRRARGSAYPNVSGHRSTSQRDGALFGSFGSYEV